MEDVSGSTVLVWLLCYAFSVAVVNGIIDQLFFDADPISRDLIALSWPILLISFPLLVAFQLVYNLVVMAVRKIKEVA